VAKEMERKLLSAEPKGQPRPETPAVSNSSGDFKVIVWTDEAGFMSSIDGQGGWFPTPHTFKVPPGAHSVVIKGGSAYKSVTAPVSVESSDVKVEVAMDRPVFEAGIALTVLGGLEAVGTLVAAIIESEGESRYHSSDHFFSAFLAAMSAPGLVLTLTGGLMIGLDKQHHPEIKVFAGNKLIATPAP
jgi:hypothetical protein